MKKTKKCYECKQDFLKTELVSYASPRAATMHDYCKKCLAEKQARDAFSDKVCTIFGIKVPGPKIWTERKRLIEKYGYTDNIIIDCLDYIYNVEHIKKKSETLYFITPTMVDKMMTYKRQQNYNAIKITQAAAMETKEYVVPIKENKEQIKTQWDPDEFLDD